MQFDNYELKKYIVSAVKDLGFKELSPIQKLVLDNIKQDKNIIAMSKTGSGKTHSFLLPIFNDLDESDKTTQAVIIAPTLELARQIYKMAAHIASFSPETIVVKAYYGGTDMKREIEKIKTNPPQIVIATPGKLVDLVIDENILKIHLAKYFVLDEADMIADSFLEEVFKISEKFKEAKKMVFSATIRESLEILLKKFLSNTLTLQVEKKDVSTLKISHYLIPVKYRDKDSMLIDLTKAINPYLSIIFANKKEEAQRLYELLKSLNLNVIALHGDLNVRERKRIVNEINNLKYQYIVASDIVARGIDIEGVSHIINYSLPRDFEFYIHRSGRTGRMYMDGICYSFYEEENQEYLDNLEKRGITFEYLDIKDQELVPFKGRNSRANRVKPVSEEEKKAVTFIPKPKKVTPGYKKKMMEKKAEITKRLKGKR
jgi:ATP-dependent RNA helicase CshB